jgi:MFS-type transporter involved in bile tolerance (Atg22 family)
MLIGATLGQNIIDNPQIKNAIFPFAALFLFVAVLPLFYATETLPERITQKRQMQSYVTKALEKVNQEGKKSQRKSFYNEENEKVKEETKETSQDEEAGKLAEKYY